MMEQVIKDFAKQFAWSPKVEIATSSRGTPRNDDIFKFKKFVVLGMGGSNLTAALLKIYNPALDIVVHKDYGLPVLANTELRTRLIVASSYSGNTEETIDGFLQARKRRLPIVVVSTGGKLLELAKHHGVLYIQIPNTGIQPRMALGFNTKALLKIIGDRAALQETSALTSVLKPAVYERAGSALAKKFQGHVPVIYSSARNQGIAYNWKIKLNETGKVPAFYNVLPELNHNEMTGLDVQPRSRALSKNLAFIFLRDSADHPRVQKRMRILEKLYRDRDLPVFTVDLKGKNSLHKIFSSLVLADWTALYTAKLYGLEAEQVPMVEEFKRLMTT